MEPFLGSEDLLIDMAELFKVFGDSTRIKILCCLFDGEMFVQELADRVGASQSGALAAALAEMVAHLTAGREKYAAAQEEMAALLEEIQKEIHKVEPDCRIVTK